MKNVWITCIIGVVITAQLACGLPGNLPAPSPSATTRRTDTPQPEPTITTTPATDAPAPGKISLEVLKNYTYWIEDFNTQAVLRDGVFDNGQIQTRLVEPAASGDLNGDSQEDAAVILATHSGGSGTFFDLILLLGQNGSLVQAGYASIGDRQGIKNLQIADGRIILDYITQGRNDPLCCPSEHRLRSYLLENSKLRLASEQILDSPTSQATPLPDAILIDQPAPYSEFTNFLQVRGRLSQSPPEMKLSYFVTDYNATLLAQGEVSVEGQPGAAGSFAFELNLDPGSPGLVQVEVVDSANGILRGRTTIVLIKK